MTPTASRSRRAGGRLALALALLPWATLVGAVTDTSGQGASGERFAVIVNPSTSASDVSLKQLRRIFLGEQQFWAGGSKVVPLIGAPGTSGRAVVLRDIYRMDELEFRRYWITKTFRADVTTGPKIVSSSALAKKLTGIIPGAVSVIPASEVDESVKVLNVDRRSPEDSEYPLVWSAP